MRAGLFLAVHALALVSLVFAPSARAGTEYDSEVQYALEKLTSGVSTAALINGREVTITPLRTWKSVSGHFCREFRMVLAGPDGKPDRNMGVRCRENTGEWTEVEPD